jgi:Bacterial Ig-like domain (group 3)/Divergent InlB B-repeat domain
VKKLVSLFGIGLLLFCSMGSASAKSILYTDWGGMGAGSYGIGYPQMSKFTNALKTASENNLVKTSNFTDYTLMNKYDAIILDTKYPGTISAPEIANIKTYIATGRKALLIGDNFQAFGSFNAQILGIVGGAQGGNYQGNTSKVIDNELTHGVNSLSLEAAGYAIGGTPLYSVNFATLWGTNVLTLFDFNILSDVGGNQQFGANVAQWIANSRLPAYIDTTGNTRQTSPGIVNQQVALVFKTGANGPFTIGALKVGLYLSNSIGSGSFTVSLRAVDGSNNPSGEDLASVVVNTGALSQGSTVKEVTTLGDLENYSLEANTNYALVVSNGTPGIGVSIGNGTPSLDPNYGFSVVVPSLLTTDNGGSWVPAFGPNALMMSIGRSTKPTSATALSAAPNPVTVGSSVTFTARVTPVAATGTVTFKEGSTTLGTGALSGGIATHDTTSLTAGVHSITAVYGGDGSYQGSTSSVYTQTINKANSSITLVSALNPSNSGQSVTFTATVSPAGITGGTVTFYDGTTALGVGALVSGTASYSISSLSGGSHGITAVYGGNSSYNGSTSASLTQTVNTVVTVGTSSEGRSFSVDGTTYTSTQTFVMSAGSSHTLAVTSPQTGAAGSRYSFTSWSDGGAQSHNVTVPTTNTTYTAAFGAQYQLTTAVNPSVSGFVLPITGSWYAAGSRVAVSVTPNAGSAFSSWSGPVADSNNAVTTITMTGPLSVTANLSGIPALSSKVTGKSGTIDNRLWTVTLTNSAVGAATNVNITGLIITPGIGVTCTPTVKSGFPVRVSDVASGAPQSGAVTLDFTGCAPTNKFNVRVDYSYGDAGGGAYTRSDSFYNMLR